jgi:hypothetical protein
MRLGAGGSSLHLLLRLKDMTFLLLQVTPRLLEDTLHYGWVVFFICRTGLDSKYLVS